MDALLAGLGLRIIVDRPGLLIALSPDTACVADEQTLLVGHLFDGNCGRPITAIPRDLLTFQPHAQDEAARRAWGAYVGFAFDHDGVALHIVRDPSGGVPCYYARAGQCVIVASHIDLIWQVKGPLSLDVEAILRHLLVLPYRDRRTCLDDIHEIMPGDRLEFDGGRLTVSSHWSPWNFAQCRARWTNRSDAVDGCRRAVTMAVGAWGRTIGRPLLYLSGGLDSSVVAAALRRADVEFEVVTIATREPAGDERHYARSVAAHLGIRLHEAFFEADRIDLMRSTAAHLPRPVARAFNQEIDRIGMALVVPGRTNGFVHGGGGDNVFCHLRSITPLVDILLTTGAGKASWQTLIALSRLTGTDIGQIGVRVARRLIERRAAYRWSVDASLLDRQATADVALDFADPWASPPNGVMPGSAAHVALLLGIRNFLEGNAREIEMPVIAPLLAQPVLEACLRTPSWMWLGADGRDRIIARDAFADQLPPDIIQRRSKATPDPVSVAVVERQRPLIRTMLLEGRLAASGLLDRMAVERLLGGDALLRASDYSRLLSLCDVEAWMVAMDGFSGRPESAFFGGPASEARILSQRAY